MRVKSEFLQLLLKNKLTEFIASISEEVRGPFLPPAMLRPQKNVTMFNNRKRVYTFTCYVLNKNTLQLCFQYTNLVYLKSTKLKQLILYLVQFNCAEVVLKSNQSIYDWAKVELLQVYFRYTLNILHNILFKDQTILINSAIITHFRCNRNVHCAQVELQIKLNYNFYISKSRAICQ